MINYPRLVAVVVSARRDADLVAMQLVDQSMFVADTARPEPMEAMFEGFGFTDALVASPFDVVDKRVDSPEDPAVLGLPPHVIGPGVLVPDQLHSS